MALLSRPLRPNFTELEPGMAEVCARLHAEAFAQAWTTLDFERLIGSAACLGEAVLDARTGSLLGFVLSRGAAGEAEILTIVVAASARRRGLGRKLLDAHLNGLAASRIETLFLEVAEDNRPARALYAEAGFTEVGRRKAYYAQPDSQPALAALVLRRAVGPGDGLDAVARRSGL